MTRSGSSSGFVPAPLAQLPWLVILLICAIGGFGVLVLFSAAGGDPKWAMPQGIRFAGFLVMALAISYVPMRWWSSAAFPLYGLFLVMLIGVELLGAVAGGSQRWLDLGIIRIQPSEMMKVAIVLACAKFYEMLPASEIRKFGAIWPAAVMIGLPAALVMLQPDLGTALMITAGGLAVMFLAGVPLRLFIGGTLALAVSVPIIVNYVLHDYQRNRVLTFLNPENDPLGTGYHISQSKIAIGSGGWFGKGFLNGTQSHLDYLPEGHTDFALATMMEEWGLMGGLFVIIAYGLLIRWGIAVGVRSQTRFAKLTAAGISTTIFFYVFINMAMVVGLAPVVGIPLPLISFGGSAQMTTLICVGILMSLDRENRLNRRTSSWQ
ncbi:rod shape-determining protein RodA [Sphingomonas sp. BT-65]|uniref:rod shape-determining protein RodA n=1 Tax=Sphingomonas sp. BT-65 TaxID=2989821 RepID=UPI002236A073|nr:rod shape-determining protein RodA [Sphingomonas sp. BT-65]MCW4460790.1 rod shape-determining protein RodA [Sphingomonas sp. BT-65]